MGEVKDDDICCVCRKDENDELVLLCDGCPRAFHTYCMNGCTCCKKKPSNFGKVGEVPQGDFYCKFCSGHVPLLFEDEKVVSMVYAFGCNEGGQLGIGLEGSDSNRKVPTLVEDLKGMNIVSMDCGGYNSIFVADTGDVYACGDGTNGKTGNVDVVHELITKFRLVERLGDEHRSKIEQQVCRVFCGRDSLAAVTEGGHMYTWGCGEEGKLAHQSMTDKKVPTKISALRELEVEINPDVCAIGWSHTLVCSDYGNLISWGSGTGGQLGTNDFRSKWVPQFLNPLQNNYSNERKEPFVLPKASLKQVCCGRQNSIAVTKEGRVYTWGGASMGQLGQGKKEALTEHEQFFGRTYENLSLPKLLDCALKSVVVSKVFCGDDHVFALSDTGTVFGWGKNESGQLATGDKSARWRPELIPALSSLGGQGRVKCISAGEGHSLAVSTHDNQVYSWGRNREGQLGLGTNDVTVVPTLIKLPEQTEGIASVRVVAGGHHSFIIVRTKNEAIRFKAKKKADALLEAERQAMAAAKKKRKGGGGAKKTTAAKKTKTTKTTKAKPSKKKASKKKK